MEDPPNPETDWAVISARRIRTLRICRLPLVAALLFVGIHGGIVAFERLGWSATSATQEFGQMDRIVHPPSSDPQTSMRTIDAESRMGTDGVPASGTEARAAGEESVSEQREKQLDLEEITGVSDMFFAQTDDGAGDTGQESQSPVTDSMTGSETPRAAKQVLRDRQSRVERDSTSVGNGANGIADSNGLLFHKKASPLSDSVAKTDEDPEVSPAEHPESSPGHEGNNEDTKEPPNGPPERSGNAVVLRNDADGVVRYLVNGEAYSLSPGETHSLGSGDSWVIRFHRGADFDNAEYTVSQGVYAFQITELGWDLQTASLPDSS